MTRQEAYEAAFDAAHSHLTDEGYVADAESTREFIIGEAGQWLCDLDHERDVRIGALRGLVDAARDIGHAELFVDEIALAIQVAEELNTAL